MTAAATAFDPIMYKQMTRAQWQDAAEAWYRWEPTLRAWLGPATELMLDLAGITAGHRVLDVAAGAGEQTIQAARRVGSTGSVLATDIAPNILACAEDAVRQAGVTNVQTRVMDGENLELEAGTFDAVISRLGVIYFPDRHKALSEMHRVLTPGGTIAAIVYSTPDRNQFFSIPVSIIRRRAQLPPPLPGQPGPFSLGSPGVLEETIRAAGFQDVETRRIAAPLRLPSAAECVRFERESFGALHQMLAGLAETERESTWQEISYELGQYESASGFEGPCELLVGVGVK